MRPVTMSGMSTRLTGLPAIFQSFGSLSATSFGGASFAASPATLPKLVLRPLGPCVITPLDAVHSATGAGLAQVILRLADGAAADRRHVAPCALAPHLRVGVGVLDAHLAPVAFEL